MHDTPPDDAPAERGLLGAVLNGAPIPEGLESWHFRDAKHRRIFQAIRETTNGSGADLVLVNSYLGGNGIDAAYLVELTNGATSRSPVNAYADRLKARARDQELWTLGEALQESIREGDTPNLVREHLDGIETVISAKGATDPLERFDFTGDPAPTDWIVEGWLTGSSTLTFLGGYGGSGKSLALQHMAVETSRSGGMVFGEPVQGGPYRVLYFDAENPAGVIAERLPSLILASADPGENLYYVKLYGSNLEDPATNAKVRATVDAFQPEIIFFDSLLGFHNRDENQPAPMRQFLRDYIRPLIRNAKAGLMAHHLGKRGEHRKTLRERLRGASGIYDEADHVWLMESNTKDQIRRIFYDKERIPGFEGALVLNYEDVELTGGLRVVPTTEKRTVRRTILDVLDEHDGVAWRQDTLKAVKAEGYSERSHTKQIKALSGGPNPLIRIEKIGMETQYHKTWTTEPQRNP